MLKHMLGLHRPDSGRVMMFGQRSCAASGPGAAGNAPELRGALPGNRASGLAYGVRQRGVAASRAHGLPGRADPRPRPRPARHGGSGGNRREVSGAGFRRHAKTRRPRPRPGAGAEVVFFDEPTTGLDVHKSNEIYRVFRATQERLGYTAVIVSHDVPKIFKLADRVALLAEGRCSLRFARRISAFRSSRGSRLRRNDDGLDLPKRAGGGRAFHESSSVETAVGFFVLVGFACFAFLAVKLGNIDLFRTGPLPRQGRSTRLRLEARGPRWKWRGSRWAS